MEVMESLQDLDVGNQARVSLGDGSGVDHEGMERLYRKLCSEYKRYDFLRPFLRHLKRRIYRMNRSYLAGLGNQGRDTSVYNNEVADMATDNADWLQSSGGDKDDDEDDSRKDSAQRSISNNEDLLEEGRTIEFREISDSATGSSVASIELHNSMDIVDNSDRLLTRNANNSSLDVNLIGKSAESVDSELTDMSKSSVISVANTSIDLNSSIITNYNSNNSSSSSSSRSSSSNSNSNSSSIDDGSISSSPFQVGDLVEVMRRCWPGINRPGGVGRIKKVYEEVSETLDSDNFKVRKVNYYYDVKYHVEKGLDKKIDLIFVKPMVQINQSRKEVILGRCRVPNCICFIQDCGHIQPDDENYVDPKAVALAALEEKRRKRKAAAQLARGAGTGTSTSNSNGNIVSNHLTMADKDEMGMKLNNLIGEISKKQRQTSKLCSLHGLSEFGESTDSNNNSAAISNNDSSTSSIKNMNSSSIMEYEFDVNTPAAPIKKQKKNKSAPIKNRSKLKMTNNMDIVRKPNILDALLYDMTVNTDENVEIEINSNITGLSNNKDMVVQHENGISTSNTLSFRDKRRDIAEAETLFTLIKSELDVIYDMGIDFNRLLQSINDSNDFHLIGLFYRNCLEMIDYIERYDQLKEDTFIQPEDKDKSSNSATDDASQREKMMKQVLSTDLREKHISRIFYLTSEQVLMHLIILSTSYIENEILKSENFRIFIELSEKIKKEIKKISDDRYLFDTGETINVNDEETSGSSALSTFDLEKIRVLQVMHRLLLMRSILCRLDSAMSISDVLKGARKVLIYIQSKSSKSTSDQKFKALCEQLFKRSRSIESKFRSEIFQANKLLKDLENAFVLAMDGYDDYPVFITNLLESYNSEENDYYGYNQVRYESLNSNNKRNGKNGKNSSSSSNNNNNNNSNTTVGFNLFKKSKRKKIITKENSEMISGDINILRSKKTLNKSVLKRLDHNHLFLEDSEVDSEFEDDDSDDMDFEEGDSGVDSSDDDFEEIVTIKPSNRLAKSFFNNKAINYEKRNKGNRIEQQSDKSSIAVPYEVNENIVENSFEFDDFKRYDSLDNSSIRQQILAKKSGGIIDFFSSSNFVDNLNSNGKNRSKYINSFDTSRINGGYLNDNRSIRMGSVLSGGELVKSFQSKTFDIVTRNKDSSYFRANQARRTLDQRFSTFIKTKIESTPDNANNYGKRKLSNISNSLFYNVIGNSSSNRSDIFDSDEATHIRRTSDFASDNGFSINMASNGSENTSAVSNSPNLNKSVFEIKDDKVFQSISYDKTLGSFASNRRGSRSKIQSKNEGEDLEYSSGGKSIPDLDISNFNSLIKLLTRSIDLSVQNQSSPPEFSIMNIVKFSIVDNNKPSCQDTNILDEFSIKTMFSKLHLSILHYFDEFMWDFNNLDSAGNNNLYSDILSTYIDFIDKFLLNLKTFTLLETNNNSLLEIFEAEKRVFIRHFSQVILSKYIPKFVQTSMDDFNQSIKLFAKTNNASNTYCCGRVEKDLFLYDLMIIIESILAHSNDKNNDSGIQYDSTYKNKAFNVFVCKQLCYIIFDFESIYLSILVNSSNNLMNQSATEPRNINFIKNLNTSLKKSQLLFFASIANFHYFFQEFSNYVVLNLSNSCNFHLDRINSCLRYNSFALFYNKQFTSTNCFKEDLFSVPFLDFLSYISFLCLKLDLLVTAIEKYPPERDASSASSNNDSSMVRSKPFLTSTLENEIIKVMSNQTASDTLLSKQQTFIFEGLSSNLNEDYFSDASTATGLLYSGGTMISLHNLDILPSVLIIVMALQSFIIKSIYQQNLRGVMDNITCSFVFPINFEILNRTFNSIFSRINCIFESNLQIVNFSELVLAKKHLIQTLIFFQRQIVPTTYGSQKPLNHISSNNVIRELIFSLLKVFLNSNIFVSHRLEKPVSFGRSCKDDRVGQDDFIDESSDCEQESKKYFRIFDEIVSSFGNNLGIRNSSFLYLEKLFNKGQNNKNFNHSVLDFIKNISYSKDVIDSEKIEVILKTDEDLNDIITFLMNNLILCYMQLIFDPELYDMKSKSIEAPPEMSTLKSATNKFKIFKRQIKLFLNEVVDNNIEEDKVSFEKLLKLFKLFKFCSVNFGNEVFLDSKSSDINTVSLELKKTYIMTKVLTMNFLDTDLNTLSLAWCLISLLEFSSFCPVSECSLQIFLTSDSTQNASSRFEIGNGRDCKNLLILIDLMKKGANVNVNEFENSSIFKTQHLLESASSMLSLIENIMLPVESEATYLMADNLLSNSQLFGKIDMIKELSYEIAKLCLNHCKIQFKSELAVFCINKFLDALIVYRRCVNILANNFQVCYINNKLFDPSNAILPIPNKSEEIDDNKNQLSLHFNRIMEDISKLVSFSNEAALFLSVLSNPDLSKKLDFILSSQVNFNLDSYTSKDPMVIKVHDLPHFIQFSSSALKSMISQLIHTKKDVTYFTSENSNGFKEFLNAIDSITGYAAASSLLGFSIDKVKRVTAFINSFFEQFRTKLIDRVIVDVIFIVFYSRITSFMKRIYFVADSYSSNASHHYRIIAPIQSLLYLNINFVFHSFVVFLNINHLLSYLEVAKCISIEIDDMCEVLCKVIGSIASEGTANQNTPNIQSVNAFGSKNNANNVAHNDFKFWIQLLQIVQLKNSSKECNPLQKIYFILYYLESIDCNSFLLKGYFNTQNFGNNLDGTKSFILKTFLKILDDIRRSLKFSLLFRISMSHYYDDTDFSAIVTSEKSKGNKIKINFNRNFFSLIIVLLARHSSYIDSNIILRLYNDFILDYFIGKSLKHICSNFICFDYGNAYSGFFTQLCLYLPIILRNCSSYPFVTRFQLWKSTFAPLSVAFSMVLGSRIAKNPDANPNTKSTLSILTHKTIDLIDKYTMVVALSANAFIASSDKNTDISYSLLFNLLKESAFKNSERNSMLFLLLGLNNKRQSNIYSICNNCETVYSNNALNFSSNNDIHRQSFIDFRQFLFCSSNSGNSKEYCKRFWFRDLPNMSFQYSSSEMSKIEEILQSSTSISPHFPSHIILDYWKPLCTYIFSSCFVFSNYLSTSLLEILLIQQRNKRSENSFPFEVTSSLISNIKSVLISELDVLRNVLIYLSLNLLRFVLLKVSPHILLNLEAVQKTHSYDLNSLNQGLDMKNVLLVNNKILYQHIEMFVLSYKSYLFCSQEDISSNTAEGSNSKIVMDGYSESISISSLESNNEFLKLPRSFARILRYLTSTTSDSVEDCLNVVVFEGIFDGLAKIDLALNIGGLGLSKDDMFRDCMKDLVVAINSSFEGGSAVDKSNHAVVSNIERFKDNTRSCKSKFVENSDPSKLQKLCELIDQISH